MIKWELTRRNHWIQEYHLCDGDLSLKAGVYRRAGIPVHSIEMYDRGELVAMVELDTVGDGILKVKGSPAEHKGEIQSYLNCEGLTPVARRYFHELLGRIS